MWHIHTSKTCFFVGIPPTHAGSKQSHASTHIHVSTQTHINTRTYTHTQFRQCLHCSVGYLGTSRKRVSFSEYSEQWDFDPGDLEGSEGSVGSISEDELLMAQGARSLQGADMGYDEMLQQGPGSSGGGGQPLSTPPKAPRSKKPPTTPGMRWTGAEIDVGCCVGHKSQVVCCDFRLTTKGRPWINVMGNASWPSLFTLLPWG